MIRKILLLFIPTVFLFYWIVSVIPANSASPASQNTPTPTPYPGLLSSDLIEINTAIQQAVSSEESFVLAYLVYETQISDIRISSDNNWARAWLSPIEPETGQVIPSEPGLVIVKRLDDQWQPILPSHAEWISAIQEAPADLLSEDEKIMFIEEQKSSAMLSAVTATYGGYYLPWTRNVTMAMTQSVRHDKYTPSGSAHYAFDFATPGTAQMFNILAAKSGKVKYFKDTCSNGSESCSNYIVLEDTNTNPTTYMLYLHLAKDSIPAELKTAGKRVAQGQFIGIADDTGVSTAHHLHFMVHTNASSYWGTSVDITFNDVSINGGRPRITADQKYCKSSDVCTSFSTYYVSGNSYQSDMTPPEGGITSPNLGSIISSNTITLNGWASDNKTGIASAQFVALYNGAWHDIGSSYTTQNFSLSWNMCNDSVPDGPVSVALRLKDVAGNQTSGLPGLVHFFKNYECPTSPPACSPAADQVALFANSRFEGNCVLLNTGAYTSASSLGVLGDDNAESLLVGSNVMATLYVKQNYLGRGESFLADDANLADNIIGANSLTSVIVSSRNTSPGVPLKIWPTSGVQFPNNSSITLVWNNGSGNFQYQAKYIKGGITTTSEWQSEPFWHLGSLSAGTYTWQVRAKNSTGESAWSSTSSFTILSSSTSPSTVTAPYNTDIEDLSPGWENSNNWDLTAERNHTPGGTISWTYDTSSSSGYDTGYPNQGDLTSPSISIPSSGTYYLRFWYLYETEGSGKNWDQRWVQISVDGGAFTNILQLFDDPMNYWLQSPVISLASYAGHSIRVRFHFETLDELMNNYIGWTIDDFSITTTPPLSCSDSNEPNNDALSSPILDTNGKYSMMVCPGGDIDYFRIAGLSGDHLGFYVQGSYSVPGSLLDPSLLLLDTDSTSPLGENDDQVLAQQTDSELYFSPTNNGIYYLKIKAWDHPSGGGNDYSYILNIFNESNDPSGNFIYPVSNLSILSDKVNLTLAASDAESGVSHVQFYWHSGNWETASNWVLIGEDWNASDGWSLEYDISQLPFQGGMAFYARIYDRAGNWISTGVWNISNPNDVFFLPLVFKQ
ncbi:MAG: peptidoglycan DD-metalloendopeptidase family protein [Chloroflexi bacterium]|nr:peptidoglycan DD-metalloendopeptidase family protein [Chloroflexota bacterium]